MKCRPSGTRWQTFRNSIQLKPVANCPVGYGVIDYERQRDSDEKDRDRSAHRPMPESPLPLSLVQFLVASKREKFRELIIGRQFVKERCRFLVSPIRELLLAHQRLDCLKLFT